MGLSRNVKVSVGQQKVYISNKSNFCHSIAEEAVDKKINLVKLNSGQTVLQRGTNSQGSKRQPALDRP